MLADESGRFKNLIATSLLKRLHFLEDRDGYRYLLRYIRDKEGRLEELIEAKYSDENIDPFAAEEKD